MALLFIYFHVYQNVECRNAKLSTQETIDKIIERQTTIDFFTLTSMSEESLASFATHVLPSKPGVKGSFSIPLGCIICPFTGTDNDGDLPKDVSSADDMYMCATCLSYLNLYCPYDSYSGSWTCVICQAENRAPSHVFASNAFNRNIVDYRQKIKSTTARSDNESIGIEKLSIHDFSDNGRHECGTMILMDGNLPTQEAAAILKSLSRHLRIDDGDASYGLVVFSEMVHVYQVGLRGLASADVYSSSMDPIESGMYVEDRMYWGTFDGLDYCASVAFGVADSGESMESNEPLQDDSEEYSYRPLSRIEQLKLKREARLKGETKPINGKLALNPFDIDQSVKIFNTAQVRSQTMKRQIRCTGEAVAYAARLIEISKFSTGRILVFTNGCCNSGQASVVSPFHDDSNETRRRGDILNADEIISACQYFSKLGKHAFDRGIGIDVFCAGNGITTGAQSLLSLTNASSGYVLNHNSFDTDAFYKNLSYIYSRTFVMRSPIQGDTKESYMNGCLVDVRYPNFISPKLKHGPCEQLIDTLSGILCRNEESIYSRCSGKESGVSDTTVESTRCRFRFGRYDTKASLSLMFQVSQNIHLDEHNYAHFQFITRHLDFQDRNSIITRVITQRVPIARSDKEIFQSLNEEVIAVLLGKEAAFRCMVTESSKHNKEYLTVDPAEINTFAQEVQNDIDATVHSMFKAYQTYSLQTDDSEFSDSNEYTIPPDLCNAIKYLHHFRRGEILGSAVQSVDERTLMRDAMIRLPKEDCLKMMAPCFWKCDIDTEHHEFKPVPASTLVLWDKSIIVGESFSATFIWSGKETLDKSYDFLRDAARKFIASESHDRFPSPTRIELHEGDSMCRKLIRIVSSSHGDLYDNQIIDYPDLRLLSEEEIIALRGKFKTYDSINDPCFRHWFWRVARARSVDGNSLCSIQH